MYILLFIVVLLLVIPVIAIASEKRNFNNGKCLHCNTSLRCFDMDSQGGRGDKCKYTIWVSYNCVVQ